MIEALRKERGWTQTELGERIGGYSQVDVSRLEKAKIEQLTTNDLKKVAKALDVNTSVFLEEEFSISISSQDKNKKPIKTPLKPQPRIAMEEVHFGPDMVPILGHANASNKAVMLNFDEPIGESLRHPNQKGVKNAFYVRIYDESMSPRYYPEELAAVAGGRMPVAKKDCVVELHSGEIYIKQFVRLNDKELICRQLNPAREWKRPASDIKAIHAIVGRG